MFLLHNFIEDLVKYLFIKYSDNSGLRLCSSNPANAPDKEEEIIKLEEKVLELKKENRLLKQQLKESDEAARNPTIQDEGELKALYRSNEAKDIRIEELQSMEQQLKTEIESKNDEIAKLNEKYTTELDVLRNELAMKNTELETKQQSNKSGNTNNGETVRSIMNQFYVKFYRSIEGKEPMCSADVLKLTAEIIRKETKAALNLN